jgi:hypothetical protein
VHNEKAEMSPMNDENIASTNHSESGEIILPVREFVTPIRINIQDFKFTLMCQQPARR